ncbi:MAG TPA: hypothetical protein VE781_13280 [Kineosporiaceae bacterium]|nr:hypothetical protein [Kineosporiaceae bacterium]
MAQVASVVAQGQASMEKLKSDLEKNCDYSNPLACALDVQRAPLEAQVLIKKLGAFTTYPPEIESLAKQTLEDAQTLADVDVSDCEKDADSAGCAGLHVAVMSQVDTMLETLAGWKPYQ